MKKLFVTFSLLLIASPLFPVFFKHIGMKEGLSQLSVMSIYQDELGRMWFGTLEGLSMYNGEQTISFKPSFSGDSVGYTNSNLLGNRNYPIAGDKKGNIYIVSDNSLIRYDFKEEKFLRLIENNVRTLTYQVDKLWIGVSDSVCIWNPKSKKAEFVLKLSDSFAQKIFVDSSKRLWIGTVKGLYLFKQNKQLECVIPNEDIFEIFEDSKANLWIATRENGMYKRDKDGRTVKFVQDKNNPNTISSNHIRSFAEDNYGNIWIGTFTGLDKYNFQTNTFKVYNRNMLPGSLTHASVFSTFKDSQGSLWIGTYYGGVNYFNPEMDLFTFYSGDAFGDNCLSYSFVGKMVEDRDNNIWICTEGGGLNFLNRKTRQFTYFRAGVAKNTISHDNLKGICYSKKYNKLYIGTHTGGLSIYDITRKTFRNLYAEDSLFRNLAGNVVNQIALYKDEYLIMLTRKGILKMSLETEQVSPLFASGNAYFSANFAIDSKDNLWVSQGWRLLRINLKDEKDQTEYKNGQNGLGRFNITKIFESRDGQMFFGTLGSGLFLLDQKTNTFIGYNAENELLQSNYCYDIVQSKQGYLIISGDKGLSVLDYKNKRLRTVDLGTALPISGINDGCGMLVCRNGEIFVGGTDGAVSFFEQDLFLSSKAYKLYFSSFYLNNELVHPNDKTNTINQSLPYTDKVVLNHNQNNLTISFASNNYVNTLKETTYEYKLEGFNKNWISTDHKSISYTNLNPGTYTLIVREKQYDPSIEPQTIKMEIVIKSPFYATPLAYVLYILFLGTMLYLLFRFKHSQFLLRTSLEYERKEKEKIEELNQAKLQFFSNISHEFRTPLTLILAQVELLLQSNSLAPTIYNKLLKIYKNAYHLRNLISELLDFGKLEQGHISLKVSEHNIIDFVKEIYLSFFEYAGSRNIDYQFHSEQNTIICWYDPKQLQKVFFNLLNNAFKFTKDNGCIEIVVEDSENEIVIKVIDNGAGINKDELTKVFDRFYQSNNQMAGSQASQGTGIGLSLSKSIVELHQGTISVESRPGYGSIFIVRLKKGKEHFSKEEYACELENSSKSLKPESFPPLSYSEDVADSFETLSSEGEMLHSILIVEDNEELLQLLVSLFSDIYKVTVARDGQEGLQKAAKERPDIVLSDIMMPKMTGTEMCLKIKNNFDLCHIPVVLLTALTSTEQSIEGLQRGADDYICKPFNAKVLVARCNNLVRNRIILQKKFTNQQDFETNSLASNPIDQRFLDIVNQIIENNIDNMEFDMNLLAKELGLSRSSLFAKFKALTGMTPNDFVLNFKLKRAAQLLKNNPELQIAEISDQLGFGSPRYFSRCFKAQFNVTPADYKRKE